MKVHGCIRVPATIGCMILCAGCMQTRPKWPESKANKPITPNAPLDYPAQERDPSQTLASKDPARTERSVSERVTDYIDNLPKERPGRASIEPRHQPTHPALLQPKPLNVQKQTASMSSVSLDRVEDDRFGYQPPGRRVLPVVSGVSIRPVAERPVPQPMPEVAMANRPVDVGQSSVALPAGIEAEIEQLEALVAQDPNEVGKQVRLRYLYLAEGMTEKALALPENMNPDQAVLLMKIVRSAIATQKVMDDPTAVSGETVEAVEDLRDWLVSNADLEIPRVVLCTSIHSYGRYEVIPDGFFVSGKANRAFLYCEVKNFATESTSDGKYRTRIAHRLELLTPQGHSVWKDTDEMEVVDICLNKRTDFFFNRLVQLPLGINPGDYVLKVTVEDKVKSRIDEASLLLEIKPAG
ncbi:MAG: hypothetical protein IID34_12615 [Planctomycetes bacterium]|nr:hypothetical protein [Planctomycetota bacterium]